MVLPIIVHQDRTARVNTDATNTEVRLSGCISSGGKEGTERMPRHAKTKPIETDAFAALNHRLFRPTAWNKASTALSLRQRTSPGLNGRSCPENP